MESIRRSESIRIFTEIRTNTQYLKNSEKNLERLRKMNSDNYVVTQINKEKEYVTKYTDILTKLNERMISLENGELDEELTQQIKTNTEIANIKSRVKFEIKEKKKQEAKEDAKFLKRYTNIERKGDYANNYNGPSAHFFRTCDNIPQYMLDKLSKLPCNKGHIWKGVYCYGELPDDGTETITMFERTYDGDYLTHKWTKDTYYLYKRNNHNKKNELIKTEKGRKSRD
jgi:hypothetical protein